MNTSIFKVPIMAWLTMFCFVKYFVVVNVVNFLFITTLLAAEPFTFDVDVEKNELKITTSKRLHYGILPRSSLYNNDNTRREPDFGTLFGITKMVNAHRAFFDLGALSTGKSITRSETAFTLKDTTNTAIGYQSNPGDVETYLLYTEFDRLSLPAVLNYLTGANIAFALLTKDSSLGKRVNDKAKNFLKGIEKGLNDYKNIAADTVEIVSMVNNLVESLLVLADVPAEHEYRVAVNSLKSAIDNVNVLLKNINAQPTTLGNSLQKYHFENGTRESKLLFNSLQKLLVGVGSNNPSIIWESAKDIDANNLVNSAIAVALFNAILKPVSDNGDFCYPKNISSYVVDTSAHQCDNSSYERVKINDVAESFVRKYVRKDQVTAEDMKRMKLAAKAVFHTGGRTLFNNIKKFAADTKSLEKTTEFASEITQKLASSVLEREVLMQFANSLFEWAMTDLAPDMARKVAVELTARLASYAVPGSGWARFAIDLADASNTGGAYAYDIFTAPRQVPFTLKTNADGITEVFKPFAVNLDKFSFLQYPVGVNTVDPYTNGEYSYQSYFLAGNGLVPENTSFQPWNINNRDATLVANGVAYSYDVRIGGFDENGAWSLSQVLKNEGKFSNGLYSVQFEVNRFEQDNLTKEPNKAFTSPLTGVVNQENETIKETYWTDGILFPWDLFNTTDYKIRHIKASSDGNDIYKWVSNNNANGTDYDSIHGKDGDSSIGFESNTLFHDLGVNDFYYLSFKELLVEAFRANYGDTFSRNYAADKGIVHVTPGIYRIKTSIGINPPDDSQATGQTKFEDRQVMFVMANTANGWNDNLLSASHIIPHIGGEWRDYFNDTVASRYFTFNRTTGYYIFNFALKENASWLDEDDKYRRSIRIALFEKEGDILSNFTFFTLSKDQGKSSNQYQFAVPAGYFEKKSDGRYTKPTLRIAWYDDVARLYCEYTGTNEEKLVEFFLKSNVGAAPQPGGQPGRAINKVFMTDHRFGDKTEISQSSKVEEVGEEPNFDLDNPSVVEDVPVDLNSPSYFAPLNPFDQWKDTWYECTRYAFGRTHEKTGTVLTFSQNTGRNGGRWYDLVNNPDLEKGSEPRSNSLAVWEYGEYGHVAFVEKVEGDKVIISEANWASPTDGLYNGFKEFTKESIKQRGNYKLLGYIYLGSSTTPVEVEPPPSITVQTLNKENGEIQISGTDLGTGGTITVAGQAVQGEWTTDGISLNTGIALDNLDQPVRIKVVDDSGNEVVNICYPFVDVCPNSWYARAVTTLWKNGIINGYGGEWEGYFRPHNPPATRAELVAATVRAKELGNTFTPLTTSPFADVKIDDWYAVYVQYAKNIGIISGCDTDNNLFCPNDSISRAAGTKVVVAAFLTDTLAKFENGKQPPRLFLDVTNPNDWYYPYIYAAEVEKVVGGYSDGNFKPDQAMTRAEMAKIICIAAFGAEECSDMGEITGRPFIFAVTPEIATLNEPTVFTVVGLNLSDAIDFELADCANVTPIAGGTAEERLFQCTPSNTSGAKDGVLHYGANQTVFTVNVQEQIAPKVTSVTPLTATLNQQTTFTVIGSDLPDNLAFWIANCDGVTALSRSPEQQQFQCTPTNGATGSQQGIVKDASGANQLKVFFVDVVAPLSEPPIEPPPTDEPPVDEPPVDEPPIDEPPVDEPPMDEPPPDTSCTPTVDSVEPLTVTISEPVTFTAYGSCLPETTAFWIGECEGMTASGGSDTERRFRCTPSWTVGSKEAHIKNEPGGDFLMPPFTVNVEWDTPRVTSVSPLSANLDEPTEFIVKGKSLTNEIAFWIGECDGMEVLNRNAEEQIFRCTPKWTTGTKDGVVKDKPGGNELKRFSVEVY